MYDFLLGVSITINIIFISLLIIFLRLKYKLNISDFFDSKKDDIEKNWDMFFKV